MATHLASLRSGYHVRELFQQDAIDAERRTQTPIWLFMRNYANRNARFFELKVADQGSVAVLGVLPVGQQWTSSAGNADKSLYLIGAKGADPYDEHALAIERMGHFLNFDLRRENAFAYYSQEHLLSKTMTGPVSEPRTGAFTL